MHRKKERQIKYRLPISQKLSYGVGHVLNDLCASMWFSYTLIYLHKVVILNSVNAGLLVLVGQVADALATPFVGYHSDRTYTTRYGRRKIWHLFGVFCVALSFPFIFSLCIHKCSHASPTALMIYYAPIIVLFQIGWASTQISHLSLIPELTVCKKGKVELNTLRYFFTIMANLLVFMVCFILFESADSGSDSSTVADNILSAADAPKFKYLAICIVAVGLVFMIIFHVMLKESPPRLNVNTSYNDSSSVNSNDGQDEEAPLIKEESSYESKVVQKSMNTWFKTLLFYQVGFLYMATRLVVNVSQIYLPYFVVETLQMKKSSIAIAPAVVYVSGIVASFVMKSVNSRFGIGLKVTFAIGLVSTYASCIWFYYLNVYAVDSTKYEVYGATVFLGFGCSTLLIYALAMISEMIGSNTDTSAFVYGSMSFLDKLSNGIAVMLIQYLHPCKSAMFCCAACRKYYGTVLVFVPGVAAVLAMIVLLTLKKSAFQTPADEDSNRKDSQDYGSRDSNSINGDGAKPIA